MLISSLISLVNELVILIYMPPNLSAYTEQSGSLVCKFVLQVALNFTIKPTLSLSRATLVRTDTILEVYPFNFVAKLFLVASHVGHI